MPYSNISGATCDGFLSKDPAAQRIVTLSDLRYVFVVMASGLFAGSITLLIEKLWKTHLKRTQENNATKKNQNFKFSKF